MDIQQVFQTAVRHHHSGRLSQAKELYQAILAEDPGHADALYLLGALAMQANEPGPASQWFARAVAAHPAAEYCFDLGFSLAALGETQRAVAALQQAITLKPSWAQAHAYLASLRQNLGELDQAVSCLQQAIVLEPNKVDWHFNLANALVALERHAESVEEFQRCLQLNPRHVGALSNLGHALGKLDRLKEAESALRQALELEPSCAVTMHNLGCVLYRQNRYQASVTVLRQALEVDPKLAGAYNDLGISLQRLGQFAAAIEAYRRALELKPQWPEALGNLGAAQSDLGRLDEAVTYLEQAVSLQPDLVSALLNLGNALRFQGRLGRAMACYDRVLEMGTSPGSPLAHWYRSQLLLSQGEFGEGWQEFEWRLDVPEYDLRRNFSQPQWKGEDIANQTILLFSEGGLGDVFHFVRYLPIVARTKAKIILECQPSVFTFFRQLPFVSSLIAHGQPLPHFDWQVPLQSLPLVFGTTMATIPADVPYLEAPAEFSKAWQQRMVNDKNLRVGLAWAGSRKMATDVRTRSLSVFAPLADIPGVSFYRLQKGPEADEPPPPGICFLNPEPLGDFLDTAGLMTNLDLIISVDTSIAHLAGALARPVWTLIPARSDFRWLLHRRDSPWYPTMKLFRQQKHKDWNEVMQQMALELRAMVRDRSDGGA